MTEKEERIGNEGGKQHGEKQIKSKNITARQLSPGERIGIQGSKQQIAQRAHYRYHE